MLHGLKKFLEYKAYKIRRESLLMTTHAGSGHPTSALSAADIVAVLFFYAMQFDPYDFNNPLNDHFILSKGHASPALYAAWKELGLIPEHQLMTYREFDSVLEGHPTLRFPYAEAATGSLGMGLSIADGMALASRLNNIKNYIYVLMGDMEISEGSVWEAAEIAAFYKLNNIVGIVDCNRLGQSSETIHGYHLNRYAQKFEAFGFKTFIIDGHDMQQIAGTFDKVRANHYDHPTMILAKTIKGYGVEEVENKEGFHGKAFTEDQLKTILPEFDARFSSAANFNEKSYSWKPTLAEEPEIKIAPCEKVVLKDPTYKKDEKIATRKAYGQAIAAAGKNCNQIVCLDAEVKNSTYADIFEQQHPDRFFQCFIAEQNMVSMAVGFDRRGKIPFVSTFACFFSRAHDQIRMAAIGNARLRLCGSHAGVSIGQDGPSQMGLEDIAMMRALPDSIVLYPGDAISTYKLVEQMANYNEGISYLRTTRGATSTIYDNAESFTIGGCKVLKSGKSDVAVVIAAGITLHEALKAYELLTQEGISIAIIDLYSVKPLDVNSIIKTAQSASNRIVTVEDHYLQGGIGEAVSYALRSSCFDVHCLAVKKLPMSGKPEELLAWAGIDAASIVKKVKEIIQKK
jgi:transketolase